MVLFRWHSWCTLGSLFGSMCRAISCMLMLSYMFRKIYIWVGLEGECNVRYNHWCPWVIGKMQKYNHILQSRAHQNFFFSDTVSFWTINSRRRIHVIINGKVLEHESKAGLFPGSVSLKLNSSMSSILQMDVRRSWKTTNTEWSGLYCFWESVKHLAVSNPSGLLQTRSENWESGSTLVEPGHPARFPSFMLEVDL